MTLKVYVQRNVIYLCYDTFHLSYYRFYLGSATSVLEFLSQKDTERIKEMKQATDLKAAQLKARSLALSASGSRAQPSSPDGGHCSWHLASSGGTATMKASNFRPFAKDPEKQKRYEKFLANMKRGQKGECEAWVSHISAMGRVLAILTLVPDLKFKYPALPVSALSCSTQCRDFRPQLLTLESENN